jgi:hypothetical protein
MSSEGLGIVSASMEDEFSPPFMSNKSTSNHEFK